MHTRDLVQALAATLLVGCAGTAGAQGLASASTTPATQTLAAVTSAAPVATVVASATAKRPTPPPAFSSVSSLGEEGTPPAAGSGPSLPVASSWNSEFVMADRIVVEKSQRRLYLMNRQKVIAEYPVKLGLNPDGHKEREGDFRTPEGTYHLSRRNPRSEYFLSLGVSYPNSEDRARARRAGVRPGGAIMIHGQPNVPTRTRDYYQRTDWTNGCIAVSNSDMVDIWLRTRVGIPIEIRP